MPCSSVPHRIRVRIEIETEKQMIQIERILWTKKNRRKRNELPFNPIQLAYNWALSAPKLNFVIVRNHSIRLIRAECTTNLF